MKLLILLLLSPAVFCQRKSTNPNDEPFLPIHPEYPYNPKLLKRGLEQNQQQQQQQQQQTFAHLTPELYAPKVDARDSYSSSYGPSSFLSSVDPYSKSATTAQSSLTSSPYSLSSLSSLGSSLGASLGSSLGSLGSSPYSLLNSYGSPYSHSPTPYGLSAPNIGASPYGAATGPYPNYYYQPPYYYGPNYYGQPPYPPPPPGYPGAPYKHPHDDEEEEEDDKRREKNKRPNSHKNRLRNSDRDSQYVDGANYIISSTKDLDGESSTHRTPSHLNQIDDSDVSPRQVIIPKATYRLVSLSGQQPNDNPNGYIKIQQLEQLMRQALTKLLAQNAVQQANLAAIQQEANQQLKDQQYITVPNTIAKTGLSYVVNPTILNRINPNQYNPSQLISGKKSTTTVNLQQSPGIYVPPTKNNNDQSSPADYGDYDSSEGVTARSQPTITNYQATAEPTQARSSYPYSTYRPTQQTNLEDVNFGTKKSKS